MSQIKFTLNLRFFVYLAIIIALPILAFVFKGGISNYYNSFTNSPHNLRVTNLTDKSASITWFTKSKDFGYVTLNGVKYYDDRDVLTALNNSATTGTDEVKNPQIYFTHQVTIKGLKADTQYSFSISNNIKTWKDKDLKSEVEWFDLPVSSNQVLTTLKESDETVTSPQPAYGSVTVKPKNGEVKPSTDSIIFAQAYYGKLEGKDRDLVNPQSLIQSSVTNTKGGWAVDKSTMRSIDGKLLTGMQLGVDRLLVYAQLSNLRSAPGRYLTWGLQDAPDQEFSYEEWDIKDAKLSQKPDSFFAKKAFAQDTTTAAPVDDGLMCCALTISGRTDLVGDFENGMPGKDCTAFDDAFEGKQLYGGTYQSPAIEVKGITSYQACEKSWSAAEVAANNAKYETPEETPPAETPGETPPPSETPGETPPPSSVNPGLTHQAADVNQTGNICCVMSLQGASKPYRDFENGVNNQNCYDLFKNVKPGGKTITSITQDVTGRISEQACVNGSTLPPVSSPGTNPGGSVGISCDTSVPEQKVPGVDKDLFAEVCYRGIYNKGKTYAAECYNDVVYRSKMAGIDPKVALITWMHESACSNYTAAKKVEDFGIHFGNNKYVSTPGNSYFNEQANFFVCRDPNLKKCPNISDPMVAWGAVYATGNCDEAAGKRWIDDMKEEWSWFADPSAFPTRVKVGNDNYCDNQTRMIGGSGDEPLSMIQNFIKKTFAQETVAQGTEFIKKDENGDKYTLFFTEEGLYDVDIDGVKSYSVVGTKGNKYEFYKEVNGTPGYQEDADQRLEIDLQKIRISKVAKTYEYNLQKGFNVISFPFLPSKDKFNPITASQFIELANQAAPGSIKGIIEFTDGQWGTPYMIDSISDQQMGNDFNLTYGKGYAVITTRNAKIQVPGSELLDPVAVNLQPGLNLVAIHGYQQEFTAQGLVDSMNKVEGVTVESITSWDVSKGRYNTYQVKDGDIFGFDFRIDPNQGYFIKLITPNEEDSLIWEGK